MSRFGRNRGRFLTGVLLAVMVGSIATLPACGAKKSAHTPASSATKPDNMEGGSAFGTRKSADDLLHEIWNPPPYRSVVQRGDFPPGAEDDPSTSKDERLEQLPPFDERRIEQEFERTRAFRDEANKDGKLDDPETLPISLGGTTPDMEFYGGNGDGPGVTEPVIRNTPTGRKVRVWYGTNRALIDPKDPGKGFGIEREPDTAKLHVGSLICDVPNSRPVGSTGSGWLTRLVTGEDDRIKVERIFVDDEELMFRQIRRRLQLAPDRQRSILVYVHGYKNSFQSAALRAAQLAVDLNVPGLTAFYSWPSRDAVQEYNADEAAVESAERHLHHFLRRMAADTGATSVHIIAHSMGNRVLARVMQRMAADPATAGLKFGQIILAAPDVDTQVFYDLASAYPKLSARTTLYVSQRDRALEASAWSHSYPRAGYAPPVAVLPPIDTVEVTDIDVSVLGHGYVAEAEHVLADIALMLRAGTPPQDRPRLARRSTPEGKAFWVIDQASASKAATGSGK